MQRVTDRQSDLLWKPPAVPAAAAAAALCPLSLCLCLYAVAAAAMPGMFYCTLPSPAAMCQRRCESLTCRGGGGCFLFSGAPPRCHRTGDKVPSGRGQATEPPDPPGWPRCAGTAGTAPEPGRAPGHGERAGTDKEIPVFQGFLGQPNFSELERGI